MIQENKENLKHTGQSNRSGCYWVKAIPTIAFPIEAGAFDFFDPSQISNEPNVTYLNVETAAGFNWIDLAGDFPATFVFTEAENIENPHCHFYNHTLLMQVPHNDYETRGKLFRAFSRCEWTLIIKQANGSVRVLGAGNNKGAKFKRSYNSGTQFKGPSVNLIEFSWQWSEQALYLKDPDGTFHLNASIDYRSSDNTLGISLQLFNQSGPNDVYLQYWKDGEWHDIALIGSVSGSYGTFITNTIPSGTYWIRIISFDPFPSFAPQVQITIP